MNKTKKKQVAVYFYEEDIEIIKEAVAIVNKAQEEAGYIKIKTSAFISEHALVYAKDIIKNGF